jgi:hypothetical protein
MLDALADHSLKQDRDQMVFPNDSLTKEAVHSAILDTFYPLKPGEWVIIIRILIVLSRKRTDPNWGVLILNNNFKWLFLIILFWHNP